MRERFPCTADEDCNDEMASFAKLGRGLQEVLQGVENALMAAGYDDFRCRDRARFLPLADSRACPHGSSGDRSRRRLRPYLSASSLGASWLETVMLKDDSIPRAATGAGLGSIVTNVRGFHPNHLPQALRRSDHDDGVARHPPHGLGKLVERHPKIMRDKSETAKHAVVFVADPCDRAGLMLSAARPPRRIRKAAKLAR